MFYKNYFANKNRYDRNEMFDFIPIVVDGLCLTMYPQPPEYDIGTFIRPYRQERYHSLYCYSKRRELLMLTKLEYIEYFLIYLYLLHL